MNALQYKQADECITMLSYEDIARQLKCSRSKAYRICSRLIENNLLICSNKDNRKGTSKSAYIPNVETLQKHIFGEIPRIQNIVLSVSYRVEHSVSHRMKQ